MKRAYDLVFSSLFFATSDLTLKAGERLEGYMLLSIAILFLISYLVSLLQHFIHWKQSLKSGQNV